ncbi:MAG: hypothetical protein Q4F13_00860 [Pseudomonadota bacterium]|nr:hypothetical protein [Pseudomonadota bacterium]
MLHGPLAAAADITLAALKAPVRPKPGSIVYCDLLFGYAEHSGVYVGRGRIVHLSRHGKIEKVSFRDFTHNTTAIGVYVSSRNGQAVGSRQAAKRALAMVSQKRKYHFILDNCHQFSAGCLSGRFDNPINFLWMLKREARRQLGASQWLLWKR